ncbi:hypothetical protein P3T76_008538 [Phytophthora citrophthora]|uniref:Uncharacterized protein n=1 Tax=Phytophthora citrophthora TaxID=4793 RepID=A0AAD9GIM7_9STRA|nr:hypothetical protein P3T76_008538 [Phytophthora citrophthora]
MPIETAKCSSKRCSEKGHSKVKCWMLHPELRPAWIKDGGGKRAGAVAVTTATGNSTSQNGTNKMWAALHAIQTDLTKIKADLN